MEASILHHDYGNHGLRESEENVETKLAWTEHESQDHELSDDDSDNNIETGEKPRLDKEGDNENVESSDPSPSILRRTERQITKPKNLDYYVLMAKEEGEFLLLCLNDEPRCFHETKKMKEWIYACEDEISSIEKLKNMGSCGLTN